jgi:hypothetical protein
MKKSRTDSNVLKPEPVLPKVPGGIKGLDVITNGGLPKGRACLMSGGPGEQNKTEKYILHLYTAGNDLRSHTAVENVKKICEDNLKGRYLLEFIDIYQDKTKNPAEFVIAAPTHINATASPIPQDNWRYDNKGKGPGRRPDLLPKSQAIQVPR